MKLSQMIASILFAVVFIAYSVTTAEVCVRYDYRFNTTINIIYHICNIKKQFDDSLMYCRDLASAPGSSLVKFYNEEIFKFTLQIMQNYSDSMLLNDLTIFIGLKQCTGNSPLVAYSGNFCWLQDDVTNNCSCRGNEINLNSTTYYAPVNDWILNFTALTVSQKSMRTFTMDKNGNRLSGDIMNTGFPTNATIMCQKLITDTAIYNDVTGNNLLWLLVLLVLPPIPPIIIIRCVRLKLKRDRQISPQTEPSNKEKNTDTAACHLR